VTSTELPFGIGTSFRCKRRAELRVNKENSCQLQITRRTGPTTPSLRSGMPLDCLELNCWNLTIVNWESTSPQWEA
jgi:hypothetical protein